MKDSVVQIRNGIEHAVYKAAAKPLFFLMDPERIHDSVSSFGALAGSTAVGRGVLKALFGYSHPALRQEIGGITFPNPIGLAGGFDKNARLTKTLAPVGFGFMEVGTITANPYEGNPKPRLQRLPSSKALIVNYGLKNDGVEAIAKRLEGKRFALPVGTNIGPTNSPATSDPKDAIKDYLVSYKRLSQVGAYTTINLSCPNTLSDMPFMQPEFLEDLLQALDEVKGQKPSFLKINPDITLDRLDSLLQIADRHLIDGFIVGNLTKNRDNPLIKDAVPMIKGGISGLPEQALTDKLLKHAYKQGKDRFIFIGLGGVFSAEDAYRKIGLGASLVQLITGMIYEGPELIGAINSGLVRLMKRDGFTSISQAIGKDNH